MYCSTFTVVPVLQYFYLSTGITVLLLQYRYLSTVKPPIVDSLRSHGTIFAVIRSLHSGHLSKMDPPDSGHYWKVHKVSIQERFYCTSFLIYLMLLKNLRSLMHEYIKKGKIKRLINCTCTKCCTSTHILKYNTKVHCTKVRYWSTLYYSKYYLITST